MMKGLKGPVIPGPQRLPLPETRPIFIAGRAMSARGTGAGPVHQAPPAMSSIATFYLLQESVRTEFEEAKRTEKTITYKRGIFRTKEIVTGERFLWEYLDEVADERIEFPYSGFVLIDYLFTFLDGVEPIQSDFAAAAIDANYYSIPKPMAERVALFLESNPPDEKALETFADQHGAQSPKQHAKLLRETHETLKHWFRKVSQEKFGVLQLTF
jgi:hypothetical protein